MIICRILLVSFLICTASAQAATYQDIFNVKSLLVVTNQSVTLVDVEKPAKECLASEPFVCIKSQSLTLAISRDPSAKKWSFAGSQYEVSSSDERGILGVGYDYKTIKVSGALNFYISYSRVRGLIAIKEPSGNTLLLSEKCGILVQDPAEGCK